MMNMDDIAESRRRAVAESIKPVSAEELKALGEKLFPYSDDPWRQAFFEFIAENPHETFHHALAGEGVEIIYCRAKDRGFWFLPKSGMGPLQARGLKMMNELATGR
jgi:hypothetical protein